VFRVAPQSYALNPYVMRGGSLIIPDADATRGIQVNGPVGRNRLYAAILPDRSDIESLVAGSPTSYQAPNVAAIVGELRRQSLAFGAYDYRIED